jgi:hypothetical protein
MKRVISVWEATGAVSISALLFARVCERRPAFIFAESRARCTRALCRGYVDLRERREVAAEPTDPTAS